jgi:DNA polymerase-3 subunit beta
MNFNCDLKQLSDAVFNVSLAVSLKSTVSSLIPSLEGVLIKANKNKVLLTGYNLEIGITKEIDAKTTTNGGVILNAKLFGDILRKLPNEKVSISVDDKLLTTITSGGSEFTIIGINESEYPSMPAQNDGKSFKISQSLIKNMINQTLFAVSTNESTPIITGSLFEISNGILKIVSVDGYRLAIRKEKINVKDDFSFIIPGRTLSDINKMLKEEIDEEIEISVSNKHITFNIDGYVVLSRLIEGDFLDYKTALSGESTTTVTVNTKTFSNTIDRASIIIADRIKSPIKCEIKENKLNLSCVSEIGKVYETFDVNQNGENIIIGFNNKYMSDALKATECDEVLIKMNGPISPIKIEPMSGDSFLFLVLPVRLKADNE